MRQTVEIFLERTVLRKNREGQQLLGPKRQRTVREKRWTFCSFDASEKFLLESFLHVSELFYCVSTRKAVAPSQVDKF